jgi:hypothetical protein
MTATPSADCRPDARPFRRTGRAFGGSLLLALALAGTLAACGEGGPAPDDGSDRALAPVVDEAYRVGSVDGSSWDAFTRVTSMAFDDGGRLHILDQGQRRVHVVDPGGVHLFSFGTPGEGPGEFRSPAGVQVLADGRIVVADTGHEAFLVFSAEGEFLRSYRFQSGGTMPGARLQRQGDQAVVAHAQGFRIEAGPGDGPPALPTTNPIQRWDLSDLEGEARRDVVLEAWRPERPQARGGGGAGGFVMRSARRSLEPGVHFAALPDGRLALADSSAYRIRVYGPDGQGDPVMIGRDIAPVPVGPAEEEAERERQLAELEAGGGPQIQIATAGPGGGTQVVPQEQIREMLRQQVANVTFWHEIPVIARLAADAEGRLWVERSGEIGEEGPIDLLEADGDYLGTIPAGELRIPMAFGPGGLAAWVELDELEVPSVRVGRIRME